MVVAADGSIDVTVVVTGQEYKASGAIGANGAVNSGVGVGGGTVVTFVGTFTSNGGSGTWSSTAGTKGTWTVTK